MLRFGFLFFFVFCTLFPFSSFADTPPAQTSGKRIIKFVIPSTVVANENNLGACPEILRTLNGCCYPPRQVYQTESNARLCCPHGLSVSGKCLYKRKFSEVLANHLKTSDKLAASLQAERMCKGPQCCMEGPCMCGKAPCCEGDDCCFGKDCTQQTADLM